MDFALSTNFAHHFDLYFPNNTSLCSFSGDWLDFAHSILSVQKNYTKLLVSFFKTNFKDISLFDVGLVKVKFQSTTCRLGAAELNRGRLIWFTCVNLSSRKNRHMSEQINTHPTLET